MPVDPSQLEKALAAIRKEYGADSVHAGDKQEPMKRISTGSLEFDIATGGGIPMGRWCHFYGGYSSSKTLTGWNVIAEAQALGLTCAYYNVENQYDKGWATKRGIDVTKLEVVEGTTIEGIGAKMEMLLGAVHVHVVDSLAAAVSIDELTAKIEDWRPALGARAWGKVFRRINERFDDVENCIVLINQVRDSFGYSGGETPPGGKFIDFMSSMSVYFRQGPWLFRDEHGFLSPDGKQGATISGDKEADGIEFAVQVKKSRVCPPLRTARMRLDFSSGQFDNTWSLAKAAVFYGIVKQGGGWYTMPDETKVQGEAKFRTRLLEDDDLRESVVLRMQEVVGV